MRAGEKLKQHWTDKAKSELLQINAYVRTDNPLAAQELMVKISETLDLLSEYPGIGRVGRMKGTQEFVISSSYLLVYRGDCHEFCVHGIIGARYTGTPHEHNYQETNLS